MADVEVPVEEPTALIGEDGNPLMRVRMRKEPRPTGRTIQTRHAGNRFGLRIDQLTMFLLAALASRVAQQQNKAFALAAQITVLATQMAALESKKR